MRRYANGLQLVLLLCGAVASGYLWRAALEPSTAGVVYISGGPVYRPVSLSAPTSVRGAKALSRHHGAARGTRARIVAAKHAGSRKTRRASNHLASLTTQSRGVSRQPVTPRGRRATPRPLHPVRPAPKRVSRPAPRPPAPPPPVFPPPPPPPPVAPAAPSTKPAADKGTRPGWGYGDRNHDHTGPPRSESKKKK